MHVAKFILYDVARKVDSYNIARKVDAVLREKSLLQVVPCNITLMKIIFINYKLFIYSDISYLLICGSLR